MSYPSPGRSRRPGVVDSWITERSKVGEPQSSHVGTDPGSSEFGPSEACSPLSACNQYNRPSALLQIDRAFGCGSEPARQNQTAATRAELRAETRMALRFVVLVLG
jgi:hypothetical protein